MLHIATIHWQSHWWIEPQLASIRRHAPGAMTWASLDGVNSELMAKFDHAWSLSEEYAAAGTPELDNHGEKLNELGRRICEVAADDDLLLFLDGDALLVSDPVAASKMPEPMLAVRRDENNGDTFPHPSYCLTTAGFWKQIGGDWRIGEEVVVTSGQIVQDAGARLLRQVAEADAQWRPLLRLNAHRLHPLWFGVYGDQALGPVVYHHGAGFRRRLSRADRSTASWRTATELDLDEWHTRFAEHQHELDEQVRSLIETDPLAFWRNEIFWTEGGAISSGVTLTASGDETTSAGRDVPHGPGSTPSVDLSAPIPTLDRLVILHAGTHKTGTTALQTNFAQREAALSAAGILYPATGRVGAGHHNLAWELLGDERFDPDGGTLAMLSEELGATSARIVLVSSEDFECLHARPLELDLLRGVFERAGFSVRVVLALRDTEDYVESLFDALVMHGLDVDRQTFLTDARRTRRVRFKTQDFNLDSAALVAEFSAAFGEGSTSSFPYDASNIARRFSAHLRSALGVKLPDLDEELRRNTRPEKLDTLARRVRDETQRHAEAEAELNDALADARQSQARTEAELAELSLRLEGVVHELTALRESTSWRLTAPLRRVTDLLRRSGS